MPRKAELPTTRRKPRKAELPTTRRKPDEECSKKYLEYGYNPGKRTAECTYKLGRLSDFGEFKEAAKDDRIFVNWQKRKKRPKIFPNESDRLVADEDHEYVGCPECGWKWFSGMAGSKAHAREEKTIDSEGNQISICLIERRDQRKRNDKAKQKGDSANSAQSAAKQRQQPAAKPAPQQPLQPLNVEPAVEQPQQQATGLDVLVQVMGESAQPSKPPETQQLSNKSALFESVDNDQALEASHDENAEQLHASDTDSTDSTASEMTKWARNNNVDDFEKALPDFEPPTQPGIMPDPSADANFVNCFFV